MNINQLDGLIPASFDCKIVDETGKLTTAPIGIKLRRMAFNTVARSEFKKAMENINDDPAVVGNLLAGEGDRPGLLAQWELFTDDQRQNMVPITCENIVNRPYDFVVDLCTTVFETLFPDPTRSGKSDNGSEPAQPSISTNNSNDDTSSPKQLNTGESAPGNSSSETTASGG